MVSTRAAALQISLPSMRLSTSQHTPCLARVRVDMTNDESVLLCAGSTKYERPSRSRRSRQGRQARPSPRSK